jgi:hypothetical protein
MAGHERFVIFRQQIIQDKSQGDQHDFLSLVQF